VTTETDIQRRIQIALSWRDARMFRNNVGEAWLGRNFTIRDGKLIDGKAHRVAYGLAPGSSDLIGLRSVPVTPQMVGMHVAVFCAVEVKSEKGRSSQEQDSFLEMVQSLGGMSGIARSVEEAKKIVTPDTYWSK
jgi:hypothetical protein